MSLTEIARRAEKLASDNSTSILTGIGVVGTVVTAYLTGKATLHVSHILDADLPVTEKVKAVWTEYIPAVGAGVLTVTCIIGSNRIGSRRAAAVAAAYSLSEKAYSEYRDKVVERLGERKAQKVRDEVAQDRMRNTPVTQQSVVMGSGDVLCCDSMSMRYFMSNMENIKKAQNDLNNTILRYDNACLTDFYDNLNLPKTAISDEIGWNTDNLLTLQFTTAMSDDHRPCLYIEYQVRPIRGYAQVQ